MKRILTLLLVAALCLCLTACDSDLPKDTFFEDAVLTELSLEGMPAPKLENSRLGDKVLYCNLTEEEYRAYIQSLLDYLQAREDIYHLGSYCSWRLLAEIVPYDIYSFIPEDYASTAGGHSLVFSLTEELTTNGYLSQPIRIDISRGEEKLGLTSYTYNTKIRLSNTSRGAEFDPCYRAHTYEEGIIYPIPGLSRGVTVQYCVYCGDSTQDFYYGNNQSYNITVPEGKGLIARSNYSERWTLDSCYAGLKIEITTYSESEILVNGEQIPLLRREESNWVYGFIMPQCDIQIVIRQVTREEIP